LLEGSSSRSFLTSSPDYSSSSPSDSNATETSSAAASTSSLTTASLRFPQYKSLHEVALAEEAEESEQEEIHDYTTTLQRSLGKHRHAPTVKSHQPTSVISNPSPSPSTVTNDPSQQPLEGSGSSGSAREEKKRKREQVLQAFQEQDLFKQLRQDHLLANVPQGQSLSLYNNHTKL
jgi:hypothetical protein